MCPTWRKWKIIIQNYFKLEIWICTHSLWPIALKILLTVIWITTNHGFPIYIYTPHLRKIILTLTMT